MESNKELIAQRQLWLGFTKIQFDLFGSLSVQILDVTRQLLEQPKPLILNSLQLF